MVASIMLSPIFGMIRSSVAIACFCLIIVVRFPVDGAALKAVQLFQNPMPCKEAYPPNV
jgi:hypothetical protein